jgi:polyisoprenyl-phosphate glycosyltransferase
MKLTVITPVFNDWHSLREVVTLIDSVDMPDVSISIVVVNDGSSLGCPEDWLESCRFCRITDLNILELACNLGHQRAIALGIAWVVQKHVCDVIVVMDSDGEDNPNDLPRLVSRYRAQPDAIIVAERHRRSERFGFRVGYCIYKLMFRILAGRRIGFGNFCAFDMAIGRRLASSPDTWNHLAAALLRSRIPIAAVPTERGYRLAGAPTTNLPILLAHGLGAFAVFSDEVFARLLLLSVLLGGAALVGVIVVVGIRLLTDLAIPGWATTALGALAIVVLQAIVICLVASVQLLAQRNQASAFPNALIDYFLKEWRRIELLRHQN